MTNMKYRIIKYAEKDYTKLEVVFKYQIEREVVHEEHTVTEKRFLRKPKVTVVPEVKYWTPYETPPSWCGTAISLPKFDTLEEAKAWIEFETLEFKLPEEEIISCE